MKEFKWFDEYRTYDWDLPLMRELGLRPFRGKIWDEIYVGHVTTDSGMVFVWVTGAPAQFWRFAIVDFGNYKTHNVTTGSGSLKEHWPHIAWIADGMLGVTSVSFDPEKRG